MSGFLGRRIPASRRNTGSRPPFGLGRLPTVHVVAAEDILPCSPGLAAEVVILAAEDVGRRIAGLSIAEIEVLAAEGVGSAVAGVAVAEIVVVAAQRVGRGIQFRPPE